MPLLRPISFVFIFGCVSSLYAQSISNDLIFAKYLLTKKNYDESIFILRALNKLPFLTDLQKDSIHFFLGNIYYNQQNLRKSIENFDSVSYSSRRLKSEAVFFSAFNSGYLNSFSEAKRKLSTYQPIDSLEQQLRNFELAGVSLLQRNYTNYDSLSKQFIPINYTIDQQEKNMSQYYKELVNQPTRSPFVAATLSAILPGAGKFYAGNKGQGVYTLLIATVLGLQTWEGYRKDGPSSFRFIAYGTLFTSLYIGTIWGSAFAVKIKRDQLNETINHQILFDMHIPLRTIFH